MRHLENYEQFNEGRFFRGALKTANVIVTGFKSLAKLITLNWSGLVFELKSIPHSHKFINILDFLKDESASSPWMENKLESYKNKYGSDMLKDIEESKDFVSTSKIKNEKKQIYLDILNNIKSTIEDALLEDEKFLDTLQGLKNKIVDLSLMARERGYESGIDYPEDWFEKPISQMEDDELRKVMDKALDDKDFVKAKFINKYLNR